MPTRRQYRKCKCLDCRTGTSQNSSPNITDTSRLVKERFDNFNRQVVASKAIFLNEMCEWKKEGVRVKLKIIMACQMKQKCLCWNMKTSF